MEIRVSKKSRFAEEVKKGYFSVIEGATELKENLSKYLLLSATEDVYITKNGKITAAQHKAIAEASEKFGGSRRDGQDKFDFHRHRFVKKKNSVTFAPQTGD